MSGVPKSRRSESPFEAHHQLIKLRKSITELLFNKFGFSEEKYKKQIDHYYESHKTNSNIDEIMERYNKRLSNYVGWFIDKERDAVMDMIRKIESEFVFGNSIYISDTPAKEDEFRERRTHINAAISGCYVLKHEIQYIIMSLPVDINKYKTYAENLEKQIALFKGVRKADNKRLRPRSKDKKNKNQQENLAEEV